MSTAALLDLIRSRKAVVGIVGQGYVGLPLALVFAEAEFPVVGLDLDVNFPKARHGRRHKLEMSSIPCTANAFAGYDAVVLSTGHKQFRDASLYAKVSLVVDTRNAVKLAAGSTTTLVKAKRVEGSQDS